MSEANRAESREGFPLPRFDIRRIGGWLRENRRMAGIIALLVLVVAVASFPLRLALSAASFERGPVQIFSAYGPVWDGRLVAVHIGPVALGDMDAGVHFWPLLIGQQRFTLEPADGGPMGARAVLTREWAGYRISDMRASLPIDRLIAPLPAGNLDFEDFGVRFSGGRCLSAEGRVTLSLRPFLAGFEASEPLTGTPRCSEDRLLLPLSNGAGTRELKLYIDASGGYRATLRLEPLPDFAPGLLEGRGFERVGGRWQMQLGGHI